LDNQIFCYLDLFDEELGDDDVFVLESIAEARQNKDDKLRVTLVFTLKDTLSSLAKIIKIIEVRTILLHLKYFFGRGMHVVVDSSVGRALSFSHEGPQFKYRQRTFAHFNIDL
jgi:hypothetical protein